MEIRWTEIRGTGIDILIGFESRNLSQYVNEVRTFIRYAAAIDTTTHLDGLVEYAILGKFHQPGYPSPNKFEESWLLKSYLTKESIFSCPGKMSDSAPDFKPRQSF